MGNSDNIAGPRFGSKKITENSNEQIFGKRYQPPKPECNPEPLRSRMQPSGPQIFYFTFNNPGPNAQGDLLVQLPFPCNSFFMTSVKGGTEASSIFFHLTRLGKIYGGAAIAAVGNEPWISLNTLPASGPNYRTVIRFKEKILQYFLDVGFEGGAGQITIANVGDDDLTITGGLYT